ncbi:MAG: hypothetical protein QOJ88_840 [Pyrinomonadaceae bacterium]|nr:hypothetical protein [Pyrinomonadaceae bacterium]
MGTVSTRSQNRKQSNAAATTGSAPSDAPVTGVMTERTWMIASASIVLVAAFLRLYDLGLVPFHHDEGVNGNFLARLVREGSYHYDPQNYHGPTLYYFAAIFPWIVRGLFGIGAQDKYGLTDVAVRMVPALFGIATILLVLTLRRHLGTIATLGAASLLAISPGAIYLSRYFIHETQFVFFTLAIVVAALKFYDDPHPLFLVAAALCAGLLFATKETAMISAAVLMIALVLTQGYRQVVARSQPGGRGKKKKQQGKQETKGNFVTRARGRSTLTLWLVIALLVFIAVNIFFYSSFFTNFPQGVYDSLRTFQFWTRTGKKDHLHPFATYLWWLLLQESPLLLLGTCGALLTVLRPAKSFAIFSALWAFGLLGAYSLIGYKTPWLALNFLVPLALTSGVALQWTYEKLREYQLGESARWLALAAILLVAIGPLPGIARIFEQVASTTPWPGLLKALTASEVHGKTFIPGYQTVDLNFFNYDNDNRYYVYVYAHTRRETLKLIDLINNIAQRTPQGNETGITIVSQDYWPLPWYLRNYKRVGYFGHMSPSTEPIIIARSDQAAEVQTNFGDRYQLVQSGFNPAGSFPLRPGVDLLLYTRRELVP